MDQEGFANKPQGLSLPDGQADIIHSFDRGYFLGKVKRQISYVHAWLRYQLEVGIFLARGISAGFGNWQTLMEWVFSSRNLTEFFRDGYENDFIKTI
jgi:hypothetical protein